MEKYLMFFDYGTTLKYYKKQDLIEFGIKNGFKYEIDGLIRNKKLMKDTMEIFMPTKYDLITHKQRFLPYAHLTYYRNDFSKKASHLFNVKENKLDEFFNMVDMSSGNDLIKASDIVLGLPHPEAEEGLQLRSMLFYWSYVYTRLKLLPHPIYLEIQVPLMILSN